RDASGSFGTGDTLDGVGFVFDMAEQQLHVPVVANLSLGTDFGPHDGNSLWEQALASFVGPDHPGRALVAAAGNSGSIVDTPQHQGIAVTGTHVRVPICVGTCDPNAQASTINGTVQAWVALRAGADLKIGLDAPSGTWIGPIADEHEEGHTDGGTNAGVIYGSDVPNTLVPKNSHGAIVIFTGSFQTGPYAVTLEGNGFADLYVDGSGDAALTGSAPAFFSEAVREATITLPASNATIISVGCTVDNPSWTSIDGQRVGITEPVLDAYGGLAQNVDRVAVQVGEVCYFSSAGPTLTGVPKPDILAPGAVVIGAMSQQAKPGSPNSIFTTQCPPKKGTNEVDPNCMQVDSGHAVALGTSMSSPMAAGIIALLFQANPLLTQDQIRALLQAGAQHGRGPSPFWDQNGAGEIDAVGALGALDEMANPDTALPDPSVSVMTLSEDYAVADGSTPITATLELRTSANHRASLFDSSRLHAIAILGGQALDAPIVRGAAPGLFTFTVAIPPGHPNERLTLGATFDGADVVPEATIPVALDAWTAGYPPYVGGGCASMSARSGTGNAAPALLLLGLLALRRRAR
ncbi:MAG TPA: S8 family serine peptidase, partial [Polyangiaceae bacterium]